MSSTAMMSFGPLLRTLLVLKHNYNKGKITEQINNCVTSVSFYLIPEMNRSLYFKPYGCTHLEWCVSTVTGKRIED